ncbi:hypothetical protein AB672_10270 [Xylella taiwanensis]|nr:hypothetical protein AB672_10270 [Xylella taiwanensis]
MLLVSGYVLLGIDCIYRALRLTQGAVDTLVRIDDKKVRAFMEAIDRADLYAVSVFAVDAVFGDDKGHDEVQRFGLRILEQLCECMSDCLADPQRV